MRIVVDFARCEGNGQCVVDAPDVFELDGEDNLIVLNHEPPREQWSQVEAAVRSCPKRALSMVRGPDGRGGT